MINEVIDDKAIVRAYTLVCSRLSRFIGKPPGLLIYSEENDNTYAFYDSWRIKISVNKCYVEKWECLISTLIHELAHYAYDEYAKHSEVEAEVMAYYEDNRLGGHGRGFSCLYHRFLVIYNVPEVTRVSDLGCTEYLDSEEWSEVKRIVYRRQLKERLGL